MKNFPKLQSKCLTVELQELTFGQSLELASMPRYQFEAATTKLLSFIVKSVKGESSPINWTVQERMYAIAHYLSCIDEDNPNFEVPGSQATGCYMDYLDTSLELSDALKLDGIEIGSIGGDEWLLYPLTGEMAESIERISVNGLSGRLHWMIGAMAAQLRMKGEVCEFKSQDELDLWMSNRVATLRAYPASDFETLYIAYRLNFEHINQLFRIDFDEFGIVALPKGVDGNLPSARFRAFTCLSRTAREDFSGVYV